MSIGLFTHLLSLDSSLTQGEKHKIGSARNILHNFMSAWDLNQARTREEVEKRRGEQD